MLSFEVWVELSDRKQYELYVELHKIIRDHLDKIEEYQNELGVLKETEQIEQEEHESGVDWDNKGEDKVDN